MDIKVKAWDPVRKQMYTDAKWVEFIVVKGELKARNYDRDGNYQYLTIIQFTGLTDKSGVDVYEGDLIKNMTGRTGRVVWHEPTAGFDSIFVSDSGDHDHLKRHIGFDTARWSLFIEVIGNIFENKELLAQGG